jgi:hypothetical protein
MRKGDSHAQRLGSVESSATHERGLHGKRVRAQNTTRRHVIRGGNGCQGLAEMPGAGEILRGRLRFS